MVSITPPFALTITSLLLAHYWNISTQLAKFMGPTWGPPGSCRPQLGPILAPWAMLSGHFSHVCVVCRYITDGTIIEWLDIYTMPGHFAFWVLLNHSITLWSNIRCDEANWLLNNSITHHFDMLYISVSRIKGTADLDHRDRINRITTQI